jgi:hypothetical protein
VPVGDGQKRTTTSDPVAVEKGAVIAEEVIVPTSLVGELF